jgi:hypothetical protein
MEGKERVLDFQLHIEQQVQVRKNVIAEQIKSKGGEVKGFDVKFVFDPQDGYKCIVTGYYE